MAAIDSLLKLIDTQRADGLRLGPGSPPALLVADGERSLSMPPLESGMVAALVEELLSEQQLETLEKKGSVSLQYVGAGSPLEAQLSREDGQLSATFRAISAPEPATPSATPVDTGVARSTPARTAGGSAPALEVGGGAGPLVELLQRAVARQAADVFLSSGETATWRLPEGLARVDGVVPTDGDLEALLAPCLEPALGDRLDRHGSVDLALELPAGDGHSPLRFRVSLFRQTRGLAAAFRPVGRRIPSLQELGLPPSLAGLMDLPHGLVLMTGATGSGKSTTLASLLALLHQTRARHVITIEDPIEYLYPPGQCLIHQRQLGTHVSSYSDGLRAALRSAPDVILVGEMRDSETIAAALTAAETGHLVLSTLHCGTAAMAVDRIIDGFAEARQSQVRLQLSDVLRTVVSQRLVEARAPGLRLPALEILHVTHAVGALIREGRSHQIATVIQTGRDHGMVSLERSLAGLVRGGQVSRQTAMAAANDPSELGALL